MTVPVALFHTHLVSNAAAGHSRIFPISGFCFSGHVNYMHSLDNFMNKPTPPEYFQPLAVKIWTTGSTNQTEPAIAF